MMGRLVAVGVVLASWAVGPPAIAHAHLEKTIPANGSVLRASPSQFVVTFATPVRMTALWLQKDGKPRQNLRPLPAVTAAQIAVPAPQLESGSYVLGWTVVSDDGHVMPGKISFTFQPAH